MATASISSYTLSLHDSLPICADVDHSAVPRRSEAWSSVPAHHAHGRARLSGPHHRSRGGARLDHAPGGHARAGPPARPDRKSTRLNSSHVEISYAVFCFKKKF